MPWLDPRLISAIASAASAASIAGDREALLGGLTPQQRAALKGADNPAAQLLLDLIDLNYRADRSPLQVWLDAARTLAHGKAQESVFAEARANMLASSIVASVRNAPDDIGAQVVHRNVPVLDRTTLRTELRAIVGPTRPTTLLVVEAEYESQRLGGCGLTRTADFVDWIAARNQQPCANVCDAGHFTPIEFVREIEADLAPVGTANKVSSLVSPYKHVELVRLIKSWIMEHDKPCWIVLDNLSELGARDPMSEFIVAMVKTLSQGRVLPHTRLVLLGWRHGALAMNPAGALAHEALSYDSIQRDHVEAYVDWVYSTLSKSQVPDQTRRAAIEEILPDDGLTGPDRLRHISAAAAAVAKTARGMGQ